MTPSTSVNHLERRKPLVLVKTIAACCALALIGYGVVEIAAHSLPVSSEAAAASVRHGMAANIERESDARNLPLTTNASPNAAVTGDEVDRVDSARECAPEKGVNTSCIFE